MYNSYLGNHPIDMKAAKQWRAMYFQRLIVVAVALSSCACDPVMLKILSDESIDLRSASATPPKCNPPIYSTIDTFFECSVVVDSSYNCPNIPIPDICGDQGPGGPGVTVTGELKNTKFPETGTPLKPLVNIWPTYQSSDLGMINKAPVPGEYEMGGVLHVVAKQRTSTAFLDNQVSCRFTVIPFDGLPNRLEIEKNFDKPEDIAPYITSESFLLLRKSPISFANTHLFSLNDGPGDTTFTSLDDCKKGFEYIMIDAQKNEYRLPFNSVVSNVRFFVGDTDNDNLDEIYVAVTRMVFRYWYVLKDVPFVLITLSGQIADGDTLTIGDEVYVFKAKPSSPPVSNEILLSNRPNMDVLSDVFEKNVYLKLDASATHSPAIDDTTIAISPKHAAWKNRNSIPVSTTSKAIQIQKTNYMKLRIIKDGNVITPSVNDPYANQ